MAKKTKQLSDQLRQIIARSGVTRYRIAQETGIDQSALSRFMHCQVGLSMHTIDKLAEYFELDLQPRRRRKGG